MKQTIEQMKQERRHIYKDMQKMIKEGEAWLDEQENRTRLAGIPLLSVHWNDNVVIESKEEEIAREMKVLKFKVLENRDLVLSRKIYKMSMGGK